MGYGGSVKTFQLFGIQYSPAFYQRKNCASTNAIYETMQNLAIAVFLSIQPISCTEDIARSVTRVSFHSLCLANHGDTTQFLRTPVTVSDCNPLLRLLARSGSWLSHVTISLLFTIAFGSVHGQGEQAHLQTGVQRTLGWGDGHSPVGGSHGGVHGDSPVSWGCGAQPRGIIKIVNFGKKIPGL